MKYIVTGGEGFIGSKIKLEVDGISYDIKSQQDILDQELLEVSSAETFGIFHCAALISVPESMEKPDMYYKTNVDGTKSVIKAAEHNNLKIVFSSSAAVYGEASTKVSEDNILNPKSPYAENKRDGEKLLEESNIPTIALRYFNIYGPNQSPEYAGVITHFITNALQGKDLIIYGDGKQVRDFVYVDDVVEANILAMEYKNSEFEIFNIGSGIETTIQQLAETIIQLTESTSQITFKDARDGDIVYSGADVTKAKQILGFEAKTSLLEGLKQTITWYRQTLR
ncbi:MAG: NAD-dependent epimerase/dehydratase family protein [Patescibacteria group bacterium]